MWSIVRLESDVQEEIHIRISNAAAGLEGWNCARNEEQESGERVPCAFFQLVAAAIAVIAADGTANLIAPTLTKL